MAAERVPLADAIVVAAGRSRRMAGTDKLEALLAGRPVLARALDALAGARGVERIVLVTAPERVGELRARPWLPASVVAVVPGGDRRQESVAAGFAALEELVPASADRVVLVHDGARPLVTPGLVEQVAAATAEHGAAIPGLAVAETLKRVVGGLVDGTVDREGIVSVQTPQGVTRGLFRQALASRPASGPETFTDEAALLEACRIPVHVIPGESTNLKVTLPADLARAEAYLGSGAPGTPATPRIGFGSDSHPFGPGGPLVLGGISIEGAPRLSGHSDGDVALHAVADALLGAASLGDLGRQFPAGPETPRGIASTDLLKAVVARLAEHGLRPASVDVTIVAARPKLAGRLDAMRDGIAGIVGLDAGRVNVKASTGNLEGTEGAGRGIAAQAVALVEKTR